MSWCRSAFGVCCNPISHLSISTLWRCDSNQSSVEWNGMEWGYAPQHPFLPPHSPDAHSGRPHTRGPRVYVHMTCVLSPEALLRWWSDAL